MGRIDQEPIKVCLLHNQVTPYRLPIFNEIGKKCNLHVIFCQTVSQDRLWAASSEGFSFSSTVLKYIKIGPFIINYTLPSFLLQHSFDIYIIGENPQNIFSEFFICIFTKLQKKKVVIWSEAISISILLQRYKQRPVKRFIELLDDIFSSFYRRFLYKFADAFIAYSKRAKLYLMGKGVKEGKIFSGGQCYPILRGEPILFKDFQIPKCKGKKMVLYLGYLRYEKGIDILIQAFQKLCRTDSILVIAGDGPEFNRLKKVSHEEDFIIFTGYVNDTTKEQLYSNADIFVLPTFHDPWGLTVNEAMSYGLPVIVTSAASCSDYLIQGNGIITSPGSIDELAQAIEYLLDNKEVRKTMGVHSLQVILEYDVSAGTKPFLDVINRVFSH